MKVTTIDPDLVFNFRHLAKNQTIVFHELKEAAFRQLAALWKL